MAYWSSQIVLNGVAIIAAIAVFYQVRTFKLFEILKFLEAPEIRKSRRIVVREITKKSGAWWDDVKDGDRLEQAATHVCATYEILARMFEFDKLERLAPKGGYGFFFRFHWAPSIVRTHDLLSDFIAHRRATYPEIYLAFSRLAEAARPHAAQIGPLAPN